MSKRWQQYVPLTVGTLVVVIVTVVLALYLYNVMHNKATSSNRQIAQVVKIIRPPPPETLPPPPPPPPLEKMEQPVEQPPDQAPEQAPAQNLGIDADASAGSDGFGLAARPGGRDLVGTGTAPFRWYTDLIKSRVNECFSADQRIAKGGYKVGVTFAVTGDGLLEVTNLLGSSGSKEKDDAIRNIKNCRVGQDRPIEMPRLITLQLVSHG